MKTEIVKVTPEIASMWLKSNKDNRVIRNTVVTHYASMMLRGEWELTHQGLAFDSKGTLMDGQHRLVAIIVSGVSVNMLVSWGVDNAKMMDRGLIRKTADILKKPKRRIEVANLFIKIGYDLSYRPSEDQILSVLDIISPYFDMFERQCTNSTRAGVTSAPIKAAVLYAVMTGELPSFVFNLYNDIVLNKIEKLSKLACLFTKLLIEKRFFPRDFMERTRGSTAQSFTFFKVLPLFKENNQDLSRWPKIDEIKKEAIRADIKTRLPANFSSISRFQVEKLLKPAVLSQSKNDSAIHLG